MGYSASSTANYGLPSRPPKTGNSGNRASSIPAALSGDVRLQHQPFAQPATFNGGFQAPASHQMQSGPPSRNVSPSDSTSVAKATGFTDGSKTDVPTSSLLTPRDGNSTRGNFKNKSWRGPPHRMEQDWYQPQAHKESFYHRSHQETAGTLQESRRFGGPEHYQSGPNCPNRQATDKDYHECSCNGCEMRNRSVWMRITNNPEGHPEDIRSRIKSGMKDVFGEVEQVQPMPRQNHQQGQYKHGHYKYGQYTFIVR